MDQVPLPSGIGQAQRRLREIQSAVDSTGARTLENASISQGTLRVKHGGNIVISDGGTLRIESGDLILGRGKIRGDALAEQFTAKTYSIPLEGAGDSPNNAWRFIRKVVVSPPSWVQRTLIIASWYAYQNVQSSADESGYQAHARLVAGGKECISRLLRYEYTLEIGVNARIRNSANGFEILEIPGNQEFSLGVQGWATAAKFAMPVQMDATCLFTRNNS